MQALFPRTPSTGRYFLQLVTIFAVTVVLLELILRGIGLTSLVLYADDPESGYRIKPNQDARYWNNRIRINGWGVRDPREFEEKSPEILRVLVLGDSVTWGGLREPQENLFTSRLEVKLPGSEIINGGVNGYSIAQMAALYRAHLSGLAPDIVVVVAIPRDFTRPPQSRLAYESVSFPRNQPQLAIPAVLEICRYTAQTRWGWDWLHRPPVAEPVGPALEKEDYLQQNLEALIDLARQLEEPVRLLLVIAPYLPGPINEELPVGVSETLHLHHIRTIYLNERIPVEPGLFVDGVHLSSYGHAKVADELALLLKAKADFGLTE